MADQIPYDNRIWDLTPAELKVAYLSLTLNSKREIAEKLDRSESAVGTHLTRIYEKLGLGAVDKDLKRQHLKDNFGKAIETLYGLYGNDEDIYREKQDKALAKRKETEQQNQSTRTPRVRSGMNNAPPEPMIPIPFTREALVRRDLIMMVIGFTAGVFLIGLLFRGDELRPTNTVGPTAVFTNTAFAQPPTPTQAPPTKTFTPEHTATPEDTATPEITPTPIPFPGRENFNVQYSSSWEPFGDPFLSTGTRTWGTDGILTVREDTTGGLEIGNIGWTDYVVSLSARNFGGNPYKFEISVRMKNLDNRIILSCDSLECGWIVVHEGRYDVLSEPQRMDLWRSFTMTVQGNTFSAVGVADGGFHQNMQLILPPKYTDQFSGGGVRVEISNFSIDYIEIQPYD